MFLIWFDWLVADFVVFIWLIVLWLLLDVCVLICLVGYLWFVTVGGC